MEPTFNSPTPVTKVKFGFSQILKPLPKFAKRLGAALLAVSAAGFGYQYLVDSHALFAKIMSYAGLAGVFLTTFFGKEK